MMTINDVRNRLLKGCLGFPLHPDEYYSMADAIDSHLETIGADKEGQHPMTTERSGMSLEMLRDELAMYSEDVSQPTLDRVYAWVAVIDAELATRNAQHSDDVAVEAFATAMKLKLAEARAKGRSGWNDKNECSQQLLSGMLRSHVDKGDPRDVANFCMFLYMRGEAIIPTRDAVVSDDASGFEYRHLSLPNADGEREWLPWQRFGTDMQIRKRAALESLASRKVAVPDGYVLIPIELAENFAKSTHVPRFRRILEEAMLASQDEVK